MTMEKNKKYIMTIFTNWIIEVNSKQERNKILSLTNGWKDIINFKKVK